MLKSNWGLYVVDIMFPNDYLLSCVEATHANICENLFEIIKQIDCSLVRAHNWYYVT